jgi:hypothetical protein
MTEASSMGAEKMRAPRWQREAEQFTRFLHEYRRNGGNAYRAALAAGYSESTAKAKSYRLGQLAEAYEHLERLGLTASASNPPATSVCTAQNSGEKAASTSRPAPIPYRESPEVQPPILLPDRGPYNCLPDGLGDFLYRPKLRRRRRWFPTCGRM